MNILNLQQELNRRGYEAWTTYNKPEVKIYRSPKADELDIDFQKPLPEPVLVIQGRDLQKTNEELLSFVLSKLPK